MPPETPRTDESDADGGESDAGDGGLFRVREVQSPWVKRLLGIPDEASLDLRDGEDVLVTYAVNHTQHRRRAVGGRFFLTSERVVFRAHRFDAALGGADVALDLAQVTGATTEPPRTGLHSFLANPLDALFGGGFRTRLAVETAEGRRELFVVPEVERVAERVDAAAADGATAGE